MKRVHLFPVSALILIALILAHSQSRQINPQRAPRTTIAPPLSIETQAATQQHINRYFHNDVVPKVKNCWGRIQGKGRIALKYSYTRSGAKWVFNKLETEESTLPSGSANLALRCMSEAVRGTSFPAEAESRQDSYVIKWTWPVPFPPNALQLTSSMFAAKPKGGDTRGGCDGMGTPARCYTCDFSTCIKVCVGHSQCTVFSGGDVSCMAEGACASGGPFGVSGGGLVIY
jgi:hypothetical protein